MLILSGPSGCGKTAAIKLLAKENSFDVIEWITPIDPAEDENSETIWKRDSPFPATCIYSFIHDF